MLTANEKIVLDELIPLYSQDDATCIETSDNINGISGDALALIFESLHQKGYIKFQKYTDGTTVISLTHNGISYKEIEAASSHPTQTFNIGNVSNSAFGNVGTVNFNNSISHIREQIEASDSSDKEALQKITDVLEMITSDEIPPKKGLLSKFSDVLERNGWYTPQVASTLLNWLMVQ